MKDAQKQIGIALFYWTFGTLHTLKIRETELSEVIILTAEKTKSSVFAEQAALLSMAFRVTVQIPGYVHPSPTPSGKKDLMRGAERLPFRDYSSII